MGWWSNKTTFDNIIFNNIFNLTYNDDIYNNDIINKFALYQVVEIDLEEIKQELNNKYNLIIKIPKVYKTVSFNELDNETDIILKTLSDFDKKSRIRST